MFKLTFSKYVKKTCKACFLQMCDLHRIIWYRIEFQEVAVLAASALLSSHLDYCNSLFRGFSCVKLQGIQNNLACSHKEQKVCSCYIHYVTVSHFYTVSSIVVNIRLNNKSSHFRSRANLNQTSSEMRGECITIAQLCLFFDKIYTCRQCCQLLSKYYELFVNYYPGASPK